MPAAPGAFYKLSSLLNVVLTKFRMAAGKRSGDAGLQATCREPSGLAETKAVYSRPLPSFPISGKLWHAEIFGDGLSVLLSLQGIQAT